MFWFVFVNYPFSKVIICVFCLVFHQILFHLINLWQPAMNILLPRDCHLQFGRVMLVILSGKHWRCICINFKVDWLRRRIYRYDISIYISKYLIKYNNFCPAYSANNLFSVILLLEESVTMPRTVFLHKPNWLKNCCNVFKLEIK